MLDPPAAGRPHRRGMTTPTSIQPDQLPATIRGYLAAHVARDTDTAAARLRARPPWSSTTARPTAGPTRSAASWPRPGRSSRYTTTLVAAERTDDEHWVATNRLEGDFPGGVVDLRYRFAMDGDLVAELVIAP